MFKRMIFIFVNILFITVSLLMYQRMQGVSKARLLTLNIQPEDNNNGFHFSQVALLNPKTKTVNILHDKLIMTTSRLQWSPDGKWLYFSGLVNNRIGSFVQRIHTTDQRVEILGEGYYFQVNTNSEELAYIDHQSRLVKANGQILDDNQIIIALTDTFDGEWLYYIARHPTTGQQDIYRIRYDGSGYQRVTDTIHAEMMVAVTPDGEWVAYHVQNLSDPSNIVEWMPYNSQPVRLHYTQHVSYLRWSLDGQYLAFVENGTSAIDRHILRVVSQPTAESISLVSSKDSQIGDILWAVDNKWLYFTTSNHRSLAQVYRIHVETKTRELLYQEENPIQSINLTWSPPIDKKWYPHRLLMGGMLILISLFTVLLWQKLMYPDDYF